MMAGFFIGCGVTGLLMLALEWAVVREYRADRDAARKGESEARADVKLRNESIAQLVNTNMRLRRSYESARLKLAINGIDVTRDSLPVPNDKQSNPNEAA